MTPITLSDFELLAKERMTTIGYEYVAGGAGDEITRRENRSGVRSPAASTHACSSTSRALDTRLTLAGESFDFPILLAPTAYHRLVHPEGEIASVRGAAAAGATLVASSFATTSIEDMAKAASRPLWFQLYVNTDRGFTRDLVQRAEAAGCSALVVTVDTPVTGLRHRETRAGFVLAAGRRAGQSEESRRGLGGAIVSSPPRARSTARCSIPRSRGRTSSGCAASRACRCRSRAC